MRRAIFESVCLGLLVLCAASTMARADAPATQPVLQLRAYGVPNPYAPGISSEADRRVLLAFRQHYPHIDPVSPTGLTLPGGSRTMDMVPMMQIAGDIAPDVLYVNFRFSHSYISRRLLYPMDRFVESLAGAPIVDSSALPLPEYLKKLEQGPTYELVEQRVPRQCWDVMRRECPYELDCPYRAGWDQPPLQKHFHVWAFPVGPAVMGLQYDRTMFSEHQHEGLEMRAPRDWEELLKWAKILTNPQNNEFGLQLTTEVPGWEYLSFLYAAGGEAVRQDDHGNWVCSLDTEPAAQAAYFYARLRLEKVQRGDRFYRGVTATGAVVQGATKFGMIMRSMDERFLADAENQSRGFGPMPAGPTGLTRSEFNSKMVGLFSGLGKDPERLKAAWEYVKYFDSPDARRIRTQAMVEAGLGTFVRPAILKQFNTDGQYDSIIRQIPPELEETYRIAFAGGVPEPYGKNCQYIYSEMNKPLGAILNSPMVVRAIDAGQPELAMPAIRQILKEATARINQKMLGNLPPAVQHRREVTAWIVVCLVVLIFAWVLRRVYRTFRPPAYEGQITGLQFYRYRWAYMLLAPALLSIAVWSYWPLAKGTVIAFQNYSVTGDSLWVGVTNFANVLHDTEFWYSLRVSLTYAGLYMIFGFGAPIALAFLLQEVPRGSIVYRTIYYLPAVLSGAVVIFLWKSFYAPDGMINQVLNGIVSLINLIPGMYINAFSKNWLDDPHFALFFCLIPTIWAGMGPGCLIYLAALKTIPDEMYEAADIDGAGISRKVFNVALPAIKALVMINFIGAMIGAVRGASGFILAMTGGGPYGQEGGATEVIGLKLFYTSFGQLDFGRGAAMAWVLGSMLIGFTVIQLQRLKNLEFKTTEKVR